MNSDLVSVMNNTSGTSGTLGHQTAHQRTRPRPQSPQRPKLQSPPRQSFKSQKPQAPPSTITLLTPEANHMIAQLQGTFERSMQLLQGQMRGIEQRVLKTNLELDSLSQSNIREARERERERASKKEMEERERQEMERKRAADEAERERLAEVEDIMRNMQEQQEQLD